MMHDDDLEPLGEEFEAVWDGNRDILYRDDDDDDIGAAPFQPGDRVYVAPAKMKATVIRQIRHYDGPESFWGNLELLYDDGVKGKSHCWQVERIRPCTCSPADNPPVPCAGQYSLTECRKYHDA